jgi:5-formyltetrahydrofolate cyclo-ligase
MARDFAEKSAARQWVWHRLAAEGVARFPFPPHGRIPNFAGAEAAAARLFEIEPWKSASAIKVNPDSPQRPLRAEALRRGITVFVATPRLRGGFKKLDPQRIPPDRMQEAAGLSRGDCWSEEVALADMPRLDAIVCGFVAVTRDGRRCGKGRAKAAATWNSPSCASSVTRPYPSPRPFTICRSSTPCPATPPISRSA